MPNTRRTKTLKHTQNTKSEDLWQKDPETIKKFLTARNDYEQLCTEVEYILKKKVSQAKIETSFIGSRAKTLNSFIEKLQRKNYKNPLAELTDLAGARVVCLYSGDLEKIESIIKEEFTIIEKINKLEELEVNEFGYGAMHFIVKLGKSSAGARYDDLRNFVCEIQVRTVVQDAWSIIQHHMSYKKESQIPSKLQRKLNSLAGLFETVDDQFEAIRDQRDIYLLKIRESSHKPKEFLDNELNIDTFIEYLKWAFPDAPPGEFDSGIVLDALISLNYKKLKEVNELIDRHKKLIPSVLEDADEFVYRLENGQTESCLDVAIALAIDSDEGQQAIPWSSDWLGVFKKYLKP
ncbi:GTP pyrophosphokinase [Pseudomonas marginalis]|uniref:GTP pyrophosphokinase n=1 Tax=Pseudomonas marginalis TaxID=298 RepID=UPI0020342DAE|nr:RelA/SpoT domain-containing protein [Pseudomonas marginalis]MCM2375556.1 RelA/SpoT domain-containing protein [Pseudomonas marginalis]